MSETENSQHPSSPKQISKLGSQHIVAASAIIISLLVAALALVLWFDVRKLRDQNRAIEAQVHTTAESLVKSDEQRAALAAGQRESEQKLAARLDSLEQGVQAIRDQIGRERGDWVAAESDYMLRYANRHLLLERDVRGALIALRSVDDLLAEGANPIYLPVREQLRSEIQALEAIPPVDVDGVALELSALSKQIDTLPLATARRDIAKAQKQETPAAEEKGSVVGRFFSAIWKGLKGMVTVRRLDQNILPLLPPEQRYFLTQNLHLRLEAARLALLRGDGVIYQDNLNAAMAWIGEYFDHDDASVKRTRDELARLAQINIAPALPEIDESLRTLERIRQKQSGGKPATAVRGRQP